MKGKTIKCLVWDLDNTLWNGTLLESEEVTLKDRVVEVIRELDEKGIVHSIASKNSYEDAMTRLKHFGIDQYFLYPEIHWNAKSASINNIRKQLNIGIDAIAFIDDQPFEREEVNSVFPEVYCLDAAEYGQLAHYDCFNPPQVTEDARRRRKMYQEEIQRKEEEENFQGPSDSFLAGLNMELYITSATVHDLARAEELTLRTNQLNATGKTYSYAELEQILTSPDHLLWVCEFKDKFGSYGKIGLVLLHISAHNWHLEMMLYSCRVMSRGIGTVMLNYILEQARSRGKTMTAGFRDTGRNRMMYMAFKMGGFTETGQQRGDCSLLSHSLENIRQNPTYIKILTQY
ncbi:HAD-IIIC family phosphatase [Chitinophaga eiseniae]|uniref:HAD-IIIC family phosphatase n=1 Tax=Chitinophaga eiseniae TaxID=634771 RepID=A0A847SJT9_9BACT|nr:HAD-IIIC family phosphatase [Chitinophaga eiseniae]NLR77738.1 HAD-IIIC family phosphatase [Chitinophaga eiseniae]